MRRPQQASMNHDVDVPPDRHYDEARHLWAQHDASTGNVRVGIDAIALESLGDLAYVALHEVGTAVTRGDTVGSLEAAKMTTTVVAPVSGTVIARNDAAMTDPSTINQEPYGAGWLVEIAPSNWEQDAADLISGEAIAPWVVAELERLRAEDRAS